MADARAIPSRPPWRVLVAVTLAVGRRPALWRAAARQLRGTAAPRWWRRPPFLPLPPPDYLAFRGQTMYGGAGALPAEDAARTAAELVRWLAWTDGEHRAQRTG